ncbi:hypothetical protein NDU88_002833 [Pleurodeles waltl]|uniref:Uncharacterized protein n=1 Tax=Pleurodeles waltl TaxID=8319 RepID=A0AAV7UYH4_PLEWA|nr:hypothetical protein NDU88_002833 [Pleurodeles waltl]
MDASAPGFLEFGSVNEATQLAVMPSASDDFAGSDHFCCLEFATQASVELAQLTRCDMESACIIKTDYALYAPEKHFHWYYPGILHSHSARDHLI